MLDMNELALMMLHEKFDFENSTLPKTCCFSTKIRQRVNNFEYINLPKEITLLTRNSGVSASVGTIIATDSFN